MTQEKQRSFYFAYGNNMCHDTMLERIKDETLFSKIGRARLKGYRLSFTTRSKNVWEDNPVSDITKDDRFSVYGIVYELDDAAFEMLEEFEEEYEKISLEVDILSPAVPPKYEAFFEVLRIDVRQKMPKTAYSKTAYVYMVPDGAKTDELIPYKKYLQRVIKAAKKRDLPKGYVESLESRLGGKGSWVSLPTIERGLNRPYPIIQLSREARNKHQIGKYVLASYDGYHCLAEVQNRTFYKPGSGEPGKPCGVDARICGVDENLRVRLDFPSIEPGQELYGTCISLKPASLAAPWQFLTPRCLILSMDRVSDLDAEKDICAIDRSVMDILGCEPGDKLTISAFDEDGKRRSIVRRAMCGMTGKWDYLPNEEPYPNLGYVHLDAESRKQLGLGAETEGDFHQFTKGYPLLVAANVRHQIEKRFLIYAFSLVSTIVGFFLVAQSVSKAIWGEISVEQNLGSLLVSGIAAFIFVLFVIYRDIRSRLMP